MNPTFSSPGAPFVPVFQPVGIADLGGRAGPPDWLWDGYLAGGAVTLLTSQWKSGKTTLVSVLLARMAKGGGALPAARCGPGGRLSCPRRPRPTRSMRDQRLGSRAERRVLVPAVPGPADVDQWQAMIDQLVARRAADGLDLVVIDPLVSFLPVRSENNANLMLDAP